MQVYGGDAGEVDLGAGLMAIAEGLQAEAEHMHGADPISDPSAHDGPDGAAGAAAKFPHIMQVRRHAMPCRVAWARQRLRESPCTSHSQPANQSNQSVSA